MNLPRKAAEAVSDPLAEWQRECARRYPDAHARLQIFSDSGIPLKPVYTAADVAHIDEGEIGMPGVYPFTRGADPLGYRFDPIQQFMFFGFGLPEDTRKRMDLYFQTPGASQILIAVDMPTYYGYDPDHALARGRVGQCGTSVCNLEDLAKLLHDVPLDKVRVGVNAPFATAPMMALYIAYAETRGYRAHELKGEAINRLFKAAWGFHPCFPAERAVRCMAEVSRYCCRHMPDWGPVMLDGYIVREQGGNAIHELAFTLATSIGITERVIEGGVSADEFLSKVSFKMNGGIDFFEEIAKFRAFRKVWAKVNAERFGCRDPRSLRPEIVIVQTSGATMTAQQPLNNIARVTVETLAAVLGGAHFVDPAAYDEALAIPTEESETIALRTSQVLFHEANVKNVTDPLAGSYYVEHLTERIEQDVYKMLEDIDRRGGLVKCWEDGWFRRQIEAEAYRWKRMVEKKEKIVVGVNEYVMDREVEVPIFRVDPRVEEVMVKRLKDFKSRRDSAKVTQSLARLRDAAPVDDALMPGLIQAAKAGATLGEMMDVLRSVYGWRVHY